MNSVRSHIARRRLAFGVALILAVIFFPGISFSKEIVNICIKYKKDIGWSQLYEVRGTVISGSALNSAVGSFTRFKSFSTYVVVFWDDDQASIFELPTSSLGTVPMFATKIEDQEGRTWNIQTNNGLCF